MELNQQTEEAFEVDSDEDANFFTVYTNVGNGKLGAQLDTFEVTCSVGSVTITT